MNSVNLHNGDCIQVMKTMPDNSVDSIVTDPPYELGFMGKSWDSTGIAFNVEVWKEALRVLKPGGHLLAFSGSRTYHRMAVAIEDAGFEIRDQIMWIYGSGFPKSHDIAKAIQKASGVEPIGFKENKDAIFYGSGDYNATPRQLFMPPLEGVAAQWQGWGTALKPAHEPLVLARKPLIGTVAANVLTWGVGGLNIDGSRVGSELMIGGSAKSPGEVMKTGLKADYKSPDKIGRWPANVIHDGSDEVVELFPNVKTGSIKPHQQNSESDSFGMKGKFVTGNHTGDSGSAARFFYCAKTSKRDRNEGLDGFPLVKGGSMAGVETREGKPTNHPIRANHHPTVKPTDLMRYLCRMITPPDGTILDPFMGSGSTGKGAVIEGFNFIGIDQSADYVEIAKARIDWALDK